MQRRIFSLLFLIAGVLFFQSVQAQTPLIVQPGIYHQNFDNNTDITLLPGVTDISPGGAAVNAANLAGGPFPSGTSVTVTANDAVITNTSNSIGNNNTGLRIQSAGDAIITASGKIAVTGTQSDWAILDIAQGQTATSTAMVKYGVLDASGAVVGPGGGLSTGSTVESGGIQADRRGNGDAIINASGNITGFVGAATATLTPGFYGLLAHSADTTSTSGGPFTGNAEVTYHSGKINITGEFARGILAWSDGGSATVTTDGGTKIILDSSGTNKGSSGVYAFATSNATATVASEIMNFGPATPPPGVTSKPYGIRAENFEVAPISVTYTGPGITTRGMNGVGIGAGAFGGGSIDVSSSGPITTNGSGAIGILAESAGGPNGAGGPIAVTTQGTITTQGPESHGILASSATGNVGVTATIVSTTGEFSTAINATSTAAAARLASGVVRPDTLSIPAITGTGLSTAGNGTPRAAGGNVTVNITSGGSIMGGWQATPFSLSDPSAPGTIGSLYGLPAAGVILSSTGGTATLTNDGSIGALSDLAIVGDPQVTNNGTITGFVQFAGGNNSITNNGTFNLRNFAQTTARGGRDTVGVAVADLGTGPGNTFNNSGTGTLALFQVAGATTLNSTGQYLPLGQASNTMALNGPLQGQLIGVARFTNSGIIDLQANPVPGDVLMITGGRGGSTPGTGGGGTFITGGTLKLDTVLNQGGPTASKSDVLVVDGTSVGSGATGILIRNAGGTGKLTVGDGILVVQVLDPTRSAPGAFQLANKELSAGVFDYRLFHGGIGGSNPGDWFLRNVIVVPPAPANEQPGTGLPPSPPPKPLPPGVFPIIGPRIATYGVVQPLARQLGLAILGTLNDRVGDTYEPDVVAPAAAPIPTGISKEGISKEGGKEVVAPPPPVTEAHWVFAPSVWSRFFAQSVDNRYRAFADPSVSGEVWGGQVGVDLLRGSLIPGHYERAGVYGAYANVGSDVNGLVTNRAATAYSHRHTGSVNLNAGSAGGYWTHIGPGGWYLDAVLQGTWYSGSASTQFSRLNTNNGWGFIGSLEGGWPFRWPQSWPQLGPGFVIEPQGQILWQKVSFDSGHDGLGGVALGDTTGPSGRIGLRTKWTIATAGGQVWQPYLRANLWRDWEADAKTVFSGRGAAPLESEATVVELGGGLTARFNANFSVYANADYAFSVDDTDGHRRDGVRGAFGVRYSW